MKQQSASQTVGPFFKIGMTYGTLNNLVQPETAGERIYIRGVVFDGKGAPVDDAIVEIWQADAEGQYSESWGFGRSSTDDNGNFWLKTIKPGQVEAQAPHINIRVFMRGLLLHTITRLYFSDEDNTNDEVLSSVPEDRQATLIAQRNDSEGTPIYRWDIHMQGDLETVFFEP